MRRLALPLALLVLAGPAGADEADPLARGMALLDGPRHEEGVALLRGVIDELQGVDDDAPKLLRRAQAHFYLQEDAEAIAALERARTLGPGDAVYPYWLGIVWQYSDATKGRTAFEAAVELDAEFGPAWLELGRLCRRQKDPEAALPALIKAAALLPGGFDANYQAGLAHSDLGMEDQAIPYLETAAKLDARHVNVRYNLGLFHYRAKSFEKARATWIEAAKLAPDDLQLHTKVLQACYALKRYDEAKRWRERILAIHKDAEDAETRERKDFCFDQFDVGNHHVMACEPFVKRKLLTYHYVFKVIVDGKVVKTVNLESNDVARELGGPAYVLGCTEGPVHRTYDVMWSEMPAYDVLKGAVVRAIQGDLPVAAESRPSDEGSEIRVNR